MSEKLIVESIRQNIDVIKILLENKKTQNIIDKASKAIILAIENGKKVLFFGNGGSAADAQHMAGEFVCRFMIDRKSLPGIALTTDTSIITAISNDYNFNEVFSRQIEGISQEGDVVFAISTSGRSENIIYALEKAKELGLVTIGLSGKKGGAMKELCDHMICIPSENTPRIQEAHLLIEHIICNIVEESIFTKSGRP